MGIGVSIWQLLILILIVILVFGTNKLRGIGTDLGNVIKGFRNAIRDGDEPAHKTEAPKEQPPEPPSANVADQVSATNIDAEVRDTTKT